MTLKAQDLEDALGLAPGKLRKLLGDPPPKAVTHADARRALEASGHRFPERAQVMAFLMCKGGVGKTTSAFFLATRLASYGARVLAIDADPQGNLTSALDPAVFGSVVDEETPILVDILSRTVAASDAILKLSPGLSLIPSTPMNATLEGKLRDLYKNPSVPIRKMLEPLLPDYDFVIIDCAPALNLTNTAVVGAADTAVLPVSPDKFSLIGLGLTLRELAQIEEDFTISIGKRVVFTRYDARETTSIRYWDEVSGAHGDRLFRTKIRTSSDVKNAIAQRFDLFSVTKSKAREDYDALAREVLGLAATNGRGSQGENDR